MRNRNDIHRPSVIRPEEYEFVAALSTKEGGQFLEQQFRVVDAHMNRTGGKFSRHEHGGSCHVCGAAAHDRAVFFHEKSGQYIYTGFDCAEKIDAGQSSLFRKVRSERQAIERAKAGKLKATALLGMRSILTRVQAHFVDDIGGRAKTPPMSIQLDADLRRRAEDVSLTIVDITRQLVKKGDLSQKQWDFLSRLLDQYDRLPEQQRERDEQNLPPAPTGKVTVTGEVLTIKPVVNDWGMTVKTLVKDDQGFKVWCTLPKAIGAAERGQRVQFSVTLEPSKDDPSFAFGKRPSKARYL